jgi:hypothetical protein
MEETQLQDTTQQTADNNTQPDVAADLGSLFKAARDGQPIAPVVPEKTEDAPVVTADAPAAEPEAKKEEPVIAEPDYATILKEKTSGKIESFESLQALLEESEKLKSTKLSDEEQKVLDMYRKGEDFSSYLQFQKTDFASMDAEQVLREKYIRDNADLPKEVAERLFEREFNAKYAELNDEYADEVDRKAAEALRDRDAGKARQEFIALQEQQKIKAYEQPKDNADGLSEEEAQKQLESYLESVKQTLTPLEKLTFNIEGQEVNVAISETDKAELTKAMEYPLGFIESRWIDKNGQPNLMQIAKDAQALLRQETNLKVSYEAGLAQGAKKLIQEELRHTTPLDITSQTQSENIVDALAKGFGQAMKQTQRF